MKTSANISVPILLLAIVLSAPAGVSTQLQLERTIPLPAVKGRIDHMAFDHRENRIFVAALGNNSVEVIELGSGRVSSIGGLHEPQGVLVIPEKNLLLVTNGGDGTLTAYDSRLLTRVRTIPFGSDADNIRYDEAGGQIYVGYGDGLGIVDAKNLNKTGAVPLGGHPESLQLEMRGTRMFVNVPDRGHIAVIDRSNKAVLAPWPVEKTCRNFSLALDEKGKRLFVGCRNPDMMIVYDTDTGRPVSKFRIAGDVDDVYFDGSRNRLYVSCGEGFLQIYGVGEQDSYPLLANIRTRRGARTSLFVPEQGFLFIAVPAGREGPAEIRRYSVPP